MAEAKTMHLGVTSDQVGKYVFLPGSVERASLIAKHFDNPVKIAHNREYLTYTGTLEGRSGHRDQYRYRRPICRNCH